MKWSIMRVKWQRDAKAEWPARPNTAKRGELVASHRKFYGAIMIKLLCQRFRLSSVNRVLVVLIKHSPSSNYVKKTSIKTLKMQPIFSKTLIFFFHYTIHKQFCWEQSRRCGPNFRMKSAFKCGCLLQISVSKCQHS